MDIYLQINMFQHICSINIEWRDLNAFTITSAMANYKKNTKMD